MGIIRLHNMMFYSYHGASRAEREMGNRYEVDVELHTNLAAAIASDRLDDTVNYKSVYETVEQIILNNKFNLVETIAARVISGIREGFALDRVVVRVRKKIPPIPGNLDHIEVELDSTQDAI